MTVAAIYDVRYYKVPNQVIIIGLVISLGCALFEGGAVVLFHWTLGTITPIIFGFLFYYFRVIGAGDIKLFAVVGSFLGVSNMILIAVPTLFVGAGMSVIHMIRFQNFRIRFQYLVAYIRVLIQTKEITPYYDTTKRDSDHCTIPLAVAILISFLYLWVKGDIL